MDKNEELKELQKKLDSKISQSDIDWAKTEVPDLEITGDNHSPVLSLTAFNHGILTSSKVRELIYWVKKAKDFYNRPDYILVKDLHDALMNMDFRWYYNVSVHDLTKIRLSQHYSEDKAIDVEISVTPNNYQVKIVNNFDIIKKTNDSYIDCNFGGYDYTATLKIRQEKTYDTVPGVIAFINKQLKPDNEYLKEVLDV